MRLFSVFVPVPPSATANVPVMEDAPRSTASLFDSKTKPPDVLGSTATVGVPPSDAPPDVIPFPPVIDCT